jgi:ribosomal protein L7Ae-like RNA K-turn-binding protein
MEKMCLLVKRADTEGVKFSPRHNYIVGSMKGFLKLPERERAKYVVLAENYDREVLNKLKQLAIEGDMERKD